MGQVPNPWQLPGWPTKLPEPYLHTMEGLELPMKVGQDGTIGMGRTKRGHSGTQDSSPGLAMPPSSPTQRRGNLQQPGCTPSHESHVPGRSLTAIYCCSPPLLPLHFGYFLWAFKLNSWSRSPWQHVLGDTSTSIYCLPPLDATYTDANPILSRS